MAIRESRTATSSRVSTICAMAHIQSSKTSLYALPLLALSFCTSLAGCQSSGDAWANSVTPSRALLARSLEYHDPQESWGVTPLQMTWTSIRPGGKAGSVYEIEITADGDFLMHGNRSGRQLEYMVVGGEAHVSVDGDTSPNEETRKQMAIWSDDEFFWRDYAGFLGSVPMNLPTADAYIHPKVVETTLDGRAVLAFDMTFEPEVGKDTYTFYFEQESARLVGLRFYRNDPSSDGETILFEGESMVGNFRLPKNRHWYTNKDDRFLGTDAITGR